MADSKPDHLSRSFVLSPSDPICEPLAQLLADSKESNDK